MRRAAVVRRAVRGAHVFTLAASAISLTLCALAVTRDGDDDSTNVNALQRGRKLLASSSTPLWRYGLIPVIAAFVGWSTNVIALKMTFYPLEFFPSFLAFAQVKGQPFGLLGGWQGIIPNKAGEMAEILVDLMTQKLIDIKEIFMRLEPKKFASIMDPEMREVTEKMFENVFAREAPTFWNGLPTRVRNEMISEAIDQSAALLEHMIVDLMENVYEVLDLKSMVVSLALNNKDKVVHMFQQVGSKEFRFIELSGIYFGFAFGLFQMVVFYFVDLYAPEHGVWLLPVFGFLVGYLTNLVALKVIFKPIEPKKVCGFTLHGVFLRRQQEVSAEFARLSKYHFCNAENLWNEMMHGTYKDRFEALVRRNVDSFVEKTLGHGGSLVKSMIGTEKYEAIKYEIIDIMYDSIPHCIPVTYDYQDEALGIEDTLRVKMQKLPAPDFERVLHPVFEQDEIKLIVVGGVLGAITGAAQYFLAFA
jgi:uncharacterized membrane protein YheB (UPF0754 family)